MNQPNSLKRRSGVIGIIIALIAVIAISAGAYVATDGFSDFSMFGIASSGNSADTTKIVSKDPRDRVADGLASLFDIEANPLYAEKLGQPELAQHLINDDSSFSGQITNLQVPMLEEMGGMTIPQDMYLNWQVDVTKKAPFDSRFDFGLGVGDEALLNFKSFVNEDILQVAIPELTDKVFGIDYSGDIAEKVNNAPALADVTEEEKAEIANYFTTLKSSIKSETFSDAEQVLAKIGSYKKLMDAYNDYKQTWVIEELAAEKFTIGGKEESLGGYNWTITKEGTAAFIEALRVVVKEDDALKADLDQYYDQLSLALSSAEEPIESKEAYYAKIDETLAEWVAQIKEYDGADPVMTMYLDDQNRAVKFETTYQYEGEEASLIVEKMGGATLDENMTGQWNLVTTEGKASIVLTRSGNTDDNASNMTINVVAKTDDAEDFNLNIESNCDFSTNKWHSEVVVTSEGETGKLLTDCTFTEIEKGTRYGLSIDDMSLTANDALLFALSAQFNVDTKIDKVEKLEGDFVDLLQMTEEEMQQIVEEVQSNGMMLMFNLQQYFQ